MIFSIVDSPATISAVERSALLTSIFLVASALLRMRCVSSLFIAIAKAELVVLCVSIDLVLNPGLGIGSVRA